LNERIRQLAEQATTYIEPTATSGEGWIFDKEKFAELIVLECSSICYKGLENGDEAASLLMNTFGVEE
jgi:hypothetical protein